ncbi:hypothetical protein BLI708_10285 [Bifidobacterium imperatoris]|uniref:Uncharacterized protein n=1 Tax=Bifidobacterium imperatoris TaxID=2020965 RepID=A0A2N5IRF8_9BIFI|nr:hypothetical protein [Bifidobacterium imperatoris]PLS24539.1 hypothetical protein Tam1G_1447 [Bifidobacterium imperatoris]QSY57581.1 hypothetical protein BLI708_10285 [Bifidobacterium imperatoris]
MTYIEDLPAYARAKVVARLNGASLPDLINAFLVEYVAEARQSKIEAAGKTLHPLSTDSALRTDADFDAFERQILDDDKN